MDIATILMAVSRMLPLARGLMDIIDNGRNSDIDEVLEVIEKLTPQVQGLVDQIEQIRTMTEDNYPEVWTSVRDDWNDAVARWNAGSTG